MKYLLSWQLSNTQCPPTIFHLGQYGVLAVDRRLAARLPSGKVICVEVEEEDGGVELVARGRGHVLGAGLSQSYRRSITIIRLAAVNFGRPSEV